MLERKDFAAPAEMFVKCLSDQLKTLKACIGKEF